MPRPLLNITDALRPEQLLARIAENLRFIPGGYELFHAIRTSLGTIRAIHVDRRASFRRAEKKWSALAFSFLDCFITEGLSNLPETYYYRFVESMQEKQGNAMLDCARGEMVKALKGMLLVAISVSKTLRFIELSEEYAGLGCGNRMYQIFGIKRAHGFDAAFTELQRRVDKLRSDKQEETSTKRPQLSWQKRINPNVMVVISAASQNDRDRYCELRDELVGLGFGPDLGDIYTLIKADKNLTRAIVALRRRISQIKEAQNPRPQRPHTILMKRKPEPPQQVAVETSSVDVSTIPSLQVAQVVVPKLPNPLEVVFNEAAAEALHLMEEVREVCPGLYPEQERLLLLAKKQYLTGKPSQIKDAQGKLDAIVRRCKEYLQRKATPAQDQPVPVAVATTPASTDKQPQTNDFGSGKHRKKRNRGQMRREVEEFVHGGR